MAISGYTPLGCQDSNLGMAAPKAAALPLGYTPISPSRGFNKKTKPNSKRIGLIIYPKKAFQSTKFEVDRAQTLA
jgi:hypothetical protein